MFAFRKFFSTPAVSNATSVVGSKAVASSSSVLSRAAATAAVSSQVVSVIPSQICAARFCASSASESSNRAGGDRRGNNQRRGNSNNNSGNNRGGGGNYNNRPVNRAQPLHATCEFYDVRDSPKDGRELRLAYRSNMQRDRNRDGPNKQMTITLLPQLGPRKTDPHDPTPQFDNANRVGLRLRSPEISEILMFMAGRVASKNVSLGSHNTRIEMEKHDTGVVSISIASRKLDGNMGEPLSFELQPHQQVQFRTFLEESLYAMWDFAAF